MLVAMKASLPFGAFLAIGVGFFTAAADPLDEWTGRGPTPTTTSLMVSLYDVAWANGIFVAAGLSALLAPRVFLFSWSCTTRRRRTAEVALLSRYPLNPSTEFWGGRARI